MADISGSLIRTTPFLSITVQIVFILNTIFNLFKYYSLALSQSVTVTDGLPSTLNTSSSGLLLVSWILDILSTINPFGLLKIMLGYIMTDTPVLYQILNDFILIPIGLIVTFYEVNYLISKIPTVSPEV